jgi:hypothetical protein
MAMQSVRIATNAVFAKNLLDRISAHEIEDIFTRKHHLFMFVVA